MATVTMSIRQDTDTTLSLDSKSRLELLAKTELNFNFLKKIKRHLIKVRKLPVSLGAFFSAFIKVQRAFKTLIISFVRGL